MATQQYCSVSVSWPTEDDRSVEDVVIYNIETDFEDCHSPGKSLESLNDLFLSPPPTTNDNTESTCTVDIVVRNTTSGLALSAVDVLSGARNIEIFSGSGEYLLLAEGSKLDVAGERKLFVSQHTFEQPQSCCQLNFVSLSDPKCLWLHSLHLTLTVVRPSPAFPIAMGPSIDMDKVNAMMADMDTDVPDGAKNIMSTMTSIQKNKERAMSNMLGGSDGKGPPTMASIMSMFASMGVASRLPPPSTSLINQAAPQPPVTTQVKPDPTPTPSNSKKKKKKKGQKSGGNTNGGMQQMRHTEHVDSVNTTSTSKSQQKEKSTKSEISKVEPNSKSKGKKQKDQNPACAEKTQTEGNNKATSESLKKNRLSSAQSDNSSKNSYSSSSNQPKPKAGDCSSKQGQDTSGHSKKKKNKGSVSSQSSNKDTSSKCQQQRNRDPASSQSSSDQETSSSSSSLLSTETSHTSNSSNQTPDDQTWVTKADLAKLEQRLLVRIDNAERTILSEMTKRLETSEQRILQHLEGLVSKMSTAFLGGGMFMNGVTAPEMD